MTVNRQFSTWVTEVNQGELYEEFKEDINVLKNAYEAMNSFCRKEQKRCKSQRKRRACWS